MNEDLLLNPDFSEDENTTVEVEQMPGEYPERWNITHPDVITNIHKEYFDAGSNVVSTNTFGANLLKFSETELEDIIKAAVLNVKTAKEQSVSEKEKYIAHY